jgi:hypothetical protein
MHCVDLISDRLFPDISLFSEAVLMCSGLAAVLFPKLQGYITIYSNIPPSYSFIHYFHLESYPYVQSMECFSLELDKYDSCVNNFNRPFSNYFIKLKI